MKKTSSKSRGQNKLDALRQQLSALLHNKVFSHQTRIMSEEEVNLRNEIHKIKERYGL